MDIHPANLFTQSTYYTSGSKQHATTQSTFCPLQGCVSCSEEQL